MSSLNASVDTRIAELTAHLESELTLPERYKDEFCVVPLVTWQSGKLCARLLGA
jgi:hypothetical protein